jgi:hypothetical protein
MPVSSTAPAVAADLMTAAELDHECCVARPETGLVADRLAVDRWAEAGSLQIGWQ